MNASYSHDLEALVGVAGLRSSLDQERRADRAFDVNWSLAKERSEESRYQRVSESDAQLMYTALTNPGMES